MATTQEAKKCILFVDDEPAVLFGLESVMRSERRRWDVLLAAGGQEALSQFATRQVDVLVSDMRMPDMDGASLLRKVRQNYPDTVRIVLSGHSNLSGGAPPLSVAHQHLAKPCEPNVLRSAIEWACNIRSMLSKDSIRRGIGEVDTLPSLPGLYLRLNKAIDNPFTSLADIANIVRQDMAMSAKILQIVNSSFFGLARRISSIEGAVSYLGTNVIRNLLLSLEVFGAFSKNQLPGGVRLDVLQRHSLFAAQMARHIARGEEAFTAAILHDIGVLLLATRFPEVFRRVLDFANQESCPLYIAERQLLGVTHAEAGAYLLGLWGLPYPIVDAVAHHHEAPPQNEASGSIKEILADVECFAERYVPLFPMIEPEFSTDVYEQMVKDRKLETLDAIAAEEARKLLPIDDNPLS